MKKDYVYIGMLVGFETYDCLVIDKGPQTCTLLYIKDRSIIENVPYGELEQPYNINGYIQRHNHNMRSLGCQNRSLFSRNEDKEYTFEDGSKVWFTSDTHFFHDNILHFCKRPFANVAEMNEYLIEEWNKVIQPDDTVFHLGDFAWGGSENWTSVLKRLNGNIHLIIGNHDMKNLRQGYLQYFESVSFQKQIVVEGRKIYLNHYPLLTWGGIYRKPEEQVWQLFGHVHSNNGSSGADESRLRYLLPYQYDVGVDNNYFKPVNFRDIEKIIKKQMHESKENIDDIDNQNLTLKNQLLMGLLTSKQLAKYHELTTNTES